MSSTSAGFLGALRPLVRFSSQAFAFLACLVTALFQAPDE
jgi:hypothetical protein